MITIQGIGLFDPEKDFYEQSDESVKKYLIEKTSAFNDFTATQRDQFNRPTHWRYEGEGVVITSERIYSTSDENYFIDKQINTLKYGNI